jgi:hypothetical protein
MSELKSLAQAQISRWMSNGDEPIRQRGSVRLAKFKKTLPADLEVTVFDKNREAYVPLLLSDGKPLKCGEVLPERADLALDEKGRLLSQSDFEARYDLFLNSFVFPEGSEVGFEPVPFVVNYIKETPDQWSESRGMVEIRYNPRIDEEFKPKKRFGPNGESEEEYLKDQAKSNGDIAAALSILAQNQAALTQFLMQQGAPGVNVPVAAPQQEAPADGMNAAAAAEAVGVSDREIAPCGKNIKKGFIKQHQRFCNSDECGGKGENTTGPEAA